MATLSDYCGPRSRIDRAKLDKLDARRWAAMPKVDGAFVRVATDRAGAIYDLRYRSGAAVSKRDADGLLGLRVGLPDAVLYGELECQTEVGIRAREARGEAFLHVFDVSRVLGKSIASAPFDTRYGWLHRWQAHEELNLDGDYAVDDQGDAHDVVTGRYVATTRSNLRRLPIVPVIRGKGAASRLWSEHVEQGGGEGIVVVRTDAPFNARGAKFKARPTETIDVLVVEVGKRAARVVWRDQSFVVSAAKREPLVVGAVYELALDGWSIDGVVPKFARVVRRRDDLAAA